jgi:uncharacterized protein YdiU (UPF0061 family)
MKNNNGINFSNSYTNLNNKMFSNISPNGFINSEVVVLNSSLATELNIDIDFLKSEEGLSFLSGNTNAYGPLYAQAYGGHQYGHFTMLGDGRALMLGEHITSSNKRFDIQLKGSGRTPYSRRGDGKATLSSMLREYLISETVNALGIPSTRSLAVLQTNEEIQRTNLEKGAVLTRVASSHIRIGTFEYAKVYGDKALIKELADYTIDRHYSQLNHVENKYQVFLHTVIKKQASLVASWQSVGFVHGVMNTDNIAISGETIDYGPCAFIDTYNPKTVFSSIDSEGRYSYMNQPYMASWGLAKLAESLLPLLDSDQETAVNLANKELKNFEKLYNEYYLKYMSKKIGITNPELKDAEMIKELLGIMEMHQLDFTNTFRYLSEFNFNNIPINNSPLFKDWVEQWQNRLKHLGISKNIATKVMKTSNPVVIARNHIVEEALIKASNDDDYLLFDELLKTLRDPFNYEIDIPKLLLQPNESNVRYITYCGT